jgi:hypothetical protein
MLGSKSLGVIDDRFSQNRNAFRRGELGDPMTQIKDMAIQWMQARL